MIRDSRDALRGPIAAGLVLLGLVLAAGAGHARNIVKPSFVVIVSEDHGHRDFGFAGSTHVSTPNLDRLVESGTLFPNGQAGSSLVKPGVRAILTGLHPFQWKVRVASLRKQGVLKDDESWIESFETVPGQLQKSGYRSFAAGRLFAKDHGIAGFTHGVESDASAGEVAPVIEFLDRHGRDPFFVYFSVPAPRNVEDVPAEARARFEGKGLSQDAITYYAGIERFDARVGEIVAYLDEQGLRSKTLIVFLASNGRDLGPQDTLDEEGRDGPRGSGTLYELGFQTPIALSWPDRFPAGRSDESIVSAVDLAPTMLVLARAGRRKSLPGHDLNAHVVGGKPWPRDHAVEGVDLPRANPYRARSRGPQRPKYQEPGYFSRNSRWRFIWNKAWGSVELYDVVNDPEQKNNVAMLHPQVAISMQKQIYDWRKEMAALINPALRKQMNAPKPRVKTIQVPPDAIAP